MNKINLHNLPKRAADAEKENRALISKLRKNKKRLALDELFHQLHEEAFEKIDCLECGNCCKSISPILHDNDIARVSKALKMRPAAFTQQYLKIDSDGDYVFNQQPCPLLMPDNYCMIYHKRPRSCRDYPHTDRKNMHQILELTIKDSYTCPAVF